MPGPAGVNPHSCRRQCAECGRLLDRDVEIAGEHDHVPGWRRPSVRTRRRAAALRRGAGGRGELVQCTLHDQQRAVVGGAQPDGLCDTPLLRPGEPRRRSRGRARAPCSSRNAARIQRSAGCGRARVSRGDDLDGVALAGDRRAEQAVVQVGHDAARPSAPSGGRAATSPAVKRGQRPGGHFLQTKDVGIIGGGELDHLVEERCPAGR